MINPSIPEIHRRYKAEIAELRAKIAALEAELASLRSSDERAKRAAYQREYRAKKRKRA